MRIVKNLVIQEISEMEKDNLENQLNNKESELQSKNRMVDEMEKDLMQKD